jgi:hypothetical protein
MFWAWEQRVSGPWGSRPIAAAFSSRDSRSPAISLSQRTPRSAASASLPRRSPAPVEAPCWLARRRSVAWVAVASESSVWGCCVGTATRRRLEDVVGVHRNPGQPNSIWKIRYVSYNGEAKISIGESFRFIINALEEFQVGETAILESLKTSELRTLASLQRSGIILRRILATSVLEFILW